MLFNISSKMFYIEKKKTSKSHEDKETTYNDIAIMGLKKQGSGLTECDKKMIGMVQSVI